MDLKFDAFTNTAKAIYHTQPCIVSYFDAIAELAKDNLKDAISTPL